MPKKSVPVSPIAMLLALAMAFALSTGGCSDESKAVSVNITVSAGWRTVPAVLLSGSCPSAAAAVSTAAVATAIISAAGIILFMIDLLTSTDDTTAQLSRTEKA